MSLSLEEVRRVRFRMAKRNVTGYEVGDVDTFIDKVEESFAQFNNERDLLRREVESARSADDVQSTSGATDDSGKDEELAALRAEVDRLKSEAAAASAGDRPDDAEASQRNDENTHRLQEQSNQLQSQNDELRAELARVRSELDEVRTQRVGEAAGQAQTIMVGTRDDASPAVIRLVQLATEQAEHVVEEAEVEATRKIDNAKQQAYEITTDARTKAERVESEARVNAEQLTRESRAEADRMTREAEGRAQHVDAEASQRRTELFTDLEQEQGELVGKVDSLRGFEASYRDNLRSYVSKHLSLLENENPEPADVPELASAPESETPRLDALAQGQDD